MNVIQVFWGEIDEKQFSEEAISAGNSALPQAFQLDWAVANEKKKLSFLVKLKWAELMKKEFGIDDALRFFRKMDSGKPYLDGHQISFNLSHTQKMVGIAFSSEGEIGVDLQGHKKFNPLITQRVFCPEEALAFEKSNEPERFFFDTWSKKEAAVKATGDGIKVGLKSFSTLNHYAQIAAAKVHLESLTLKPYLSAAVGSTLPIDQLKVQSF